MTRQEAIRERQFLVKDRLRPRQNDFEDPLASVIAADGDRVPKLHRVDVRFGFNQLRAGSPRTPILQLSTSLGQARTIAARLRLGMLPPGESFSVKPFFVT